MYYRPKVKKKIETKRNYLYINKESHYIGAGIVKLETYWGLWLVVNQGERGRLHWG